MQKQKNSSAYSLSMRDLAVMKQTQTGLQEMTALSLQHPDLPPLWSKLPYIMILQSDGMSEKHFWKQYRQFNELLNNTDSHYRSFYIPKSGSGVRELLVPDYELRRHQRFIQKEILYKIPVSQFACAYHKHRGLTDLASPHVGHKVLIHLDIQDFFSSITEQMVFKTLLKETGYSKTVAGFLSRLCCYKQHLPQGASTSPALSNLCFKACDEALATLARQKGLVYTRYSDDLYFSGDQVNAPALISAVRNILAGWGFRLQESKTSIRGKHQAQMVTAIVVNDRMQVSRDYRRKLRQELYYLKRFGENAKAAAQAECYETYLQQLMGRIAFVRYVDPGNQTFLQEKELLEQIIWDYSYNRMPF